jgi:hypothetical protein
VRQICERSFANAKPAGPVVQHADSIAVPSGYDNPSLYSELLADRPSSGREAVASNTQLLKVSSREDISCSAPLHSEFARLVGEGRRNRIAHELYVYDSEN